MELEELMIPDRVSLDTSVGLENKGSLTRVFVAMELEELTILDQTKRHRISL
jgi:dTDP-4-dehydrorhamnose 3,5-epimerase-like enzyme